MPEATGFIMLALIINLWLINSASEGVSLRVLKWYKEAFIGKITYDSIYFALNLFNLLINENNYANLWISMLKMQ